MSCDLFEENRVCKACLFGVDLPCFLLPVKVDQSFHLFGRQVLRLVNDQVLVQERASAHEVQALDFDAAANQLIGSGTPPLSGAGFCFAQDFQVVVQCAHPRAHFFFFGAG